MSTGMLLSNGGGYGSAHPSRGTRRGIGVEVVRTMASMVERPIARVHGVTPPDPSPRSRTYSRYRSELSTSAVLVGRRQNACAPISRHPRRPSTDQARALWALVIGLQRREVFEETMNRVSAGSRSRTASAKSVRRCWKRTERQACDRCNNLSAS